MTTPDPLDELVGRLRASATLLWNGDADDKIAGKVLHEAADAIDRLRAELAESHKLVLRLLGDA